MNNNFIKEKLLPILVVIATLALAGIAVFTAIRLYQLRNDQVAPNAPDKPRADSESGITTKACQVLAFTLGATPTPTPSGSPAPTPTVSPTPTPSGSPAPTPTGTSTPAPTATATAAPTASPTNPPSLPESGFDLPTIGGVILGTIVIFGSALLLLAL